jgi:hypothetical protein
VLNFGKNEFSGFFWKFITYACELLAGATTMTMNERRSTLLQIQENFTHLGAGAKAVAEQTRAATMAICFIILDAKKTVTKSGERENEHSRLRLPGTTFTQVELGSSITQYTFYVNGPR